MFVSNQKIRSSGASPEASSASCFSSLGAPPQLLDGELTRAMIASHRREFLNSDTDFQRLASPIMKCLKALTVAFGSLEAVRGARIVDVACGSRLCDGNREGRFDPWMSRVLHHLGARPLGVDIALQWNEPFESRVVDLTMPGALDFLEAQSIDGYYVHGFPNSATLTAIDRQGSTWESVRSSIEGSLTRALRPTGTIVRGFTEENEEWVRSALAKPR
jgi:hypothetical protein